MRPPSAGPYDQSSIERRDDILVYSTPPLTKDVEVTCPVHIELFAATDAVDTDFTGKLLDVWRNLFRSGHRIRVEVSSSNFPEYDRNPNTGHAIGQDAEGLTSAIRTDFRENSMLLRRLG